jgi:hypothetical protein
MVDPDRLAELLAAAAAPAARGELAGEEAAMSAFREAHLGPAVQLRRQSVIKTALVKLLTLKVAATALTVTAAGGVALAAGTGNLPQSLGGAAPSSHPTPTRDAKAHHTPKAAAAHDGHSASPSPSLVGLCHAYQAGAGDNPGKALGNPSFTHLITVAGGKDAVAAYCADLLKTHPGKAHASHPAGTHTQASSAHATRPTSARSTHPTGAPTAHPTRSTHPVH